MKKLVVANWKMNPETVKEARDLLSPIEHKFHGLEKNVEVVVCAPYVFLPSLKHAVHWVKLGAQNVSWLDHGSLTGETSGKQLNELGIKYVILGHSERRNSLGETDAMVNKKIIQALKLKMIPIVCLGADPEAQEDNMTPIVTKQFHVAIKDLDQKQIEKIVFVYEPTWAISTSKQHKPATGEHARDHVEQIRTLLANQVGKERSNNMQILYGGTVNKDNVHEYAMHSEIDGALVGAASLDPSNFWEVINEFSRENIHRR
jgi:triosephosphate isomerase (TIM)